MKNETVWEKRKKAQEKIIEGLQIITPLSVKLPQEMVGKDEYHVKLHPRQIEKGVEAFLLTLLMSAGSTPTVVGEVDLYELIQKYLILPDFRRATNDLMREHPLLSENIITQPE